MTRATAAEPSSSSASDVERGVDMDKSQTHHSEMGGNNQAEIIRTVSRVPGNPNYYEKDGLRTYGDGVDHDTDTPVCKHHPLAVEFTKLTPECRR
jgi:hypothetical protein